MSANVIPAVTAVLVQGIQAWILMARIAGMNNEQLNEIWKAELEAFRLNTPDKLPDA